MTTTNIKSLCEDLITTSNSDENIFKNLIKIHNILKMNEKFQKEIFINLSDKGLSKIMLLIKSDNIDVRKLSVKLLIELIYNNEVLQNIFCEKFNFNPIGSVICLNWFPKVLKENLTLDANIINDIKSCKYQTKNKYWIWPQNNKYNDENFPDPQKYLIGFFYSNKAAYIIPNQIIETHNSDNIKNLIVKLELEEEKEETSKNNLSKNKIEQAAGSGSESSTKMREKKSDSENFEKFTKTEPVSNEDIKKTESNQNNINKINVINKVNKLSNYSNHGNINKVQPQRNVSPFSNQQIIFNVKTKIDKKAALNSSDIPIIKNEPYKYEKTNNSKNKHHYSKSIDTKEQNENVFSASNAFKNNNKSPIPSQINKK